MEGSIDRAMMLMIDILISGMIDPGKPDLE
jgi:hypothetical protein